MSINYANGRPVGKNGVPQYNTPPNYPAVASNGNTNVSVSSVLSLSENTAAIEVAAVGAGVYVKWIQSTSTNPSVFGVTSVGATNAPNYDHFVPAATFRRFVVPQDSTLQSPSQPFTYGSPSTVAFASMVGVNIENSLYRRVAILGAGSASVLTTEFR